MERGLLVKSNRAVLEPGGWGLWAGKLGFMEKLDPSCNLEAAVSSLPVTTRGRRGVRFNFF